MIGYDTGFDEVADRVWVARYEWHDVNVTLVGGSRGLLMIDTHSSSTAARQVIADAERAGLGPIVAAMNTHEHFDHTLGNAYVRRASGAAPIYATREAAARTLASAELFKARFSGYANSDARYQELLDTEVVAADALVDDELALDLGDRYVDLLHPGRGHTGGDLVAWVPDASVLVAGDLIEQTGPPVFVDNCFPLDWPITLDALARKLGAGSVVIPGHGQPIDLAFVNEQASGLHMVAQTIRCLASSGVPIDRARAVGEWPWPTDDWRFSDAIARGYAQLGITGR